MTTLIVLASIALLIVVAVQIGRISELSAKIRGEESAELESNNFNARLGVFFVVAFLVTCVASAWYYKNYMLGYGPLTQASEHGPKIQRLFNITLFFTGIVFVLTHIALFWFAYKYRGEKGKKVLFIPHDNRLEVIWTVIPAVVMCFLVISGLWVWNDVMADVKEGEDVLEVEATAYQFAWEMRYPGADNAIGTKYFRNIVPGTNDLGIDFNDPKSHDDIVVASGELVIPKGKKIRVRITAKDVLHNFYLPHFSVKMDAIPGLPTYFVFTPTKTTEEYRMQLKAYPEYNVPADPAEPNGPKKWEVFNFELACAELCGRGHYSMRRIVRVVNQDEYQKWISEKKPMFTESIEGKIEPNKYTWYKGASKSATSEAPKEFSAVAITEAKAGEVLQLNHVNFATGSAKLTAESSAELDIVVDAMIKDPKMTVEVSGHTDNVGNPAKNKALSEARAKTVAAYVTAKGIAANRMMGVGFGDAKPLVANDTPDNMRKNRRTEFKILAR
jgi:cytochrome c oxidase subunit II